MGPAIGRTAGLAAAPPLAARLTGDTLATVLVTAVAQAMALGLQLLLARGLGAEQFGLYSIAIGWLGLGLILAKAGLDTALVRLVAGFRATGDPGRAAAALRFARRSALGWSVPVAAVVMTLAPAALPAAAGGGALPLLVALLLPLAAWSELQAAALRGLRRLTLAVAGDGIVRPLVTAGLVTTAWLAVPGSATAPVALAAYLGGTAAAALLTGAALRGVLGPAGAPAPAAARAGWRRLGLSLMVANGALVAMYSLDAVLLGWLAGPREAGLFGVASRVAVAVLFVMNATQLAGGPRLAAAVALGDAAGLGAVVRTMNRLALLAAVPVALLVALPAGWLLGLFGAEFTAAADVLRILVVAQLLNVLTGPTGTVLSMGGRERDLAMLVTAGLGLHVVLAAWLIPAHGLAGAAGAGLIAHTAWNVAAAWRVRRVFGIDPTVLGLLRRA